jgi:hypothetical protein
MEARASSLKTGPRNVLNATAPRRPSPEHCRQSLQEIYRHIPKKLNLVSFRSASMACGILRCVGGEIDKWPYLADTKTRRSAPIV